MKKMLLSLITISVIATLTACGLSNDSDSEEIIIEDEEVLPQESAEAIEEAEDLKEENKEEENSDEEWVSGKYVEMNFSYPSDSDYSEGEDSVTITIVPSEKIMFLYAQEMDSDFAEKYLPGANLSILEAFENVNNTESYDLTIDGLEAVGDMGEGDFNDWTLNYKLASVYDEKSGYLYTIEYTSTTDTDEDTAIYDIFIDSISFD